MQIIVPGKKKRRFIIAYVAAALFVLAAAGAAAFFSVRVFRWTTPLPAAQPQDAEETRLQAEIKRLEDEIDHLNESLYQAEEFRDRAKYMEAVAIASSKNLEADRAWAELQKHTAGKRGLYEGMQQSFFEGWPNRFSDEEKIAMIAERHAIAPETVKAVKSDVEVVFADEYLDKFGPEETDEPAQDERAARGAPS